MKSRIDIPTCPTAGNGVHSWLMSAANNLAWRGWTVYPICEYLEDAVQGCGRPVTPKEITDAAQKAVLEVRREKRGGTTANTQYLASKRCSEAKYDEKSLRRFAEAGPHPSCWTGWLRNRSPIDPSNVSPAEFLNSVFDEGNLVLCFSNFRSKKSQVSFRVGLSDQASLDCLSNEKDGAWFLSNPVDGQWHWNDLTNSHSCRSVSAITKFRFAVLESDLAPHDLWLSAIVRLSLPISAIYTSGRRSIHILLKVDAETEAEWRKIISPELRRKLKILGADNASLSPVRLTRLPGCRRNGRMQKLLFLNPKPPQTKLADLPLISPPDSYQPLKANNKHDQY